MGDSQPKKVQVIYPRRGEIYLVGFDPAVGHEIRKTRPALILQNDIGNEFSPTTIVAALTSRISSHPYPVEVVIGPAQSGLRSPSTVRLDQLRTVDRSRLLKRIGKIVPETMEQVDTALMISLALAED
jgi:mRNA interferase MazF